MSKLDKLTCHIINCGYVNAESVTSIQNSIEITATGRPIASSENVIIFEKSYLGRPKWLAEMVSRNGQAEMTCNPLLP